LSALRAGDRAQTVDLVREFLAVRTSRRASAGLSPELVSYEQNREWLEALLEEALQEQKRIETQALFK
jgi:hypothetical protein